MIIENALNTREEAKEFSEEWSNLVEGYQLLCTCQASLKE